MSPFVRNMKCSYYLDRPYNPDIDRDILKKEIASAKAAKRKLSGQ